jgi:hypothetical protein
MRVLLLLAPTILAGCASTQEALSAAPSEVIRSPKSVNEVAFCLANKNNVPALDGAFGEKIIQIKNSVGAVGVIFSVFPDGSGSRVEMRKPIGVSVATHRQCY